MPSRQSGRRGAGTEPGVGAPTSAGRGGGSGAGAEAERIHNRIAVLRTERGVSRRQLAEALGVHYQTVGYLERGEYNPSLHLALRIARYFEVPVEVVFSTEPFPRIGS
ncbi:DNA-binding XRE family transcriptional regulator [Streptomonospora nanhaiensis]|uniref:DNA-binding XRE family transcriptional regulator n=1 Tax=Streptomonospora nanhaiensis TaxID=1323731 RepID=A0A853BHF2_9ACTN|nr:DNA-binding XRE family transcriptional regulator [Streptomonospora nanhaiensis]